MNSSKRDKQKQQFFNEGQWIGSPLNSKRDNGQPQQSPLSSDVKDQQTDRNYQTITSSISKKSNNKSPVQLIQDILKGIDRQSQKQVSPFYSKENQQLLAELLTNKSKLSSYIKGLEIEMVGLDDHVVKNYEVLVHLLQQVSQSDVQVKHDQYGLQFRFNRTLIQRQQSEIERLQRQLQEKDKQTKQIIEQYESIIRNFNDVMEKLITKEDSKRTKY